MVDELKKGEAVKLPGIKNVYVVEYQIKSASSLTPVQFLLFEFENGRTFHVLSEEVILINDGG